MKLFSNPRTRTQSKSMRVSHTATHSVLNCSRALEIEDSNHCQHHDNRCQQSACSAHLPALLRQVPIRDVVFHMVCFHLTVGLQKGQMAGVVNSHNRENPRIPLLKPHCVGSIRLIINVEMHENNQFYFKTSINSCTINRQQRKNVKLHRLDYSIVLLMHACFSFRLLPRSGNPKFSSKVLCVVNTEISKPASNFCALMWNQSLFGMLQIMTLGVKELERCTSQIFKLFTSSSCEMETKMW